MKYLIVVTDDAAPSYLGSVTAEHAENEKDAKGIIAAKIRLERDMKRTTFIEGTTAIKQVSKNKDGNLEGHARFKTESGCRNIYITAIPQN